MHINFEEERPIFLQIAEQIGDAILSGAFPEETQIPSTTEISVGFKINPATALKGINILVEQGIVYKRRGVGMFVAPGALNVLKKNRREAFYENYVLKLVTEAKRLNLSKSEMINMIERGLTE